MNSGSILDEAAMIHRINSELSFVEETIMKINEGQEFFGKNSFITFTRGMCHVFDDKLTQRQSAPIVSNTREKSLDVHSSKSLNIPDNVFFDSESGKQLISNDQVFHESIYVQETECDGSWNPCSSKKKSLSVGKFSDVLYKEDLFDNQKSSIICFPPTPEVERKCWSVSSVLDLENIELPYMSDFDLETKESVFLGTPTPVKFLKFSTPKWAEDRKHLKVLHRFNDYVAPAHMQQRTPMKKEMQEINEVFSLEVPEAISYESNCNSGASVYSTHTAVKNCSVEWIIEPKLVILDPVKGNRVKLINNSTEKLRFKTVFNSRFTNVCPLSGIVLAKNHVGLRISISKWAKMKQENFECDIKLIIEKNVKSIHVKFIKERTYKRPFIL